LGYLSGNISKTIYELQLEIRNRPSVQYFLLPITTINDSAVQFMLVKVDERLRRILNNLHTQLIINNDLPSASVENYDVEKYVILITSDKAKLEGMYDNIDDSIGAAFIAVSVIDSGFHRVFPIPFL